ncbi:hypothetical protein HUG10_21520 (plasmid) [Halorarum halophilum]|uniref:Uncharacterized protein n=1 Tax=Halorarum halophilum TaxID=2743090 RepID=A0A7D5GIT7_9EURY|nr:hypothetical protein [Halobaculum halophilum]QLG30170.1 hypothetical protein HUG10_21520 [Halobaculum halophilum]
MANDTIENIASFGETTEDDVLRREVVRELLYKQAGNLSVGTQLVDTTTFNMLDVKFDYPGEMSAEYPVAQDTTVDRQKITWNEFDMSLQQGEGRYFIADSAKLRGMGDLQQRFTQQRQGEALARRKDENILETLLGGAPSSNDDTQAGGDEWDTANADIVEEMTGMWTDILTNAPINNANIGNFSVVLPIEIWAELNQVELINNVQQQLREYLGSTFGFSIYPTKLGLHEDDQVNLQDEAIMMIPGDETAIHGVLSDEAANSAGVPLVEQERIAGRGEEYIVSQWFNTAIVEHEGAGSGESPRIAVRRNINSNQ